MLRGGGTNPEVGHPASKAWPTLLERCLLPPGYVLLRRLLGKASLGFCIGPGRKAAGGSAAAPNTTDSEF